jgi:hypothetical protein
MEFDFKAYFDKILDNKSEFDLCILVTMADQNLANLANQIKLIIEGKNPGSENHIGVLFDDPDKKVTFLLYINCLKDNLF